MDFCPSPEQEQIRGTVREFAEAELRPHVMAWDEAAHFPAEILPKLAELGLLGVIFPEEYGGAGLGYLEYAIVLEELARVDGSVGLIVSSHTSLCTNPHLPLRRRGAAAALRGAVGAGRTGCWRPHGVRGRLSTQPANARRAPRWRLRAERRQDLHHQRPPRGRMRGHGVTDASKGAQGIRP